MELNEKHKAYLDWRADPDRQGSKREFAKSIGVADSTLRTWDKESWFKSALEKRLVELNISPDRTQSILDALHEKAARGDVQAAKTMLDYVNRISPPTRVERDEMIENLTDDELELAWREGLSAVQSN